MSAPETTTATADRPSAWLPYSARHSPATVRLICLGHAGAAASLFATWKGYYSADVQLCPVQLPGRETRIAESPLTRIDAVVDGLAAAVLPYLDRPFAIFGHSLGALLGFELARRIRETHDLHPLLLMVSGCAAPQTVGPCVLSPAAADLKHQLRQLAGTPEDVLGNDELMELCLPRIRADLLVHDSYRYVAGRALETAITVFRATDDPIAAPSAMSAWETHTAGRFRMVTIAGDHFSIYGDPSLVARTLQEELALCGHDH